MVKHQHLSQKSDLQSLYNITLVVYILQTIALFTALPMIIAVIINYIKLEQTHDTWLATHFRWQIRTFWFGLLWYIIGIATYFFFIGFVIIGIVWIWQVYRVIRGWVNLSEHRQMYR